MQAAHRLAHALGCNFIPTTILTRHPKVDEYRGLMSPDAPRLPRATLERWRDDEAAELRLGREATAWALLPSSNRIVVLGADSPEWTERLLARQPTPLVVRSPTPGRAHLYYRWPDGVDLSSKCNVAGVDTYDLKARATIHAPGSLHKSRRGRYVCELPEAEQVPGLRDRLPVLDLALVEDDKRLVDKPRTFERVEWEVDRWSLDGEGERRYAALLRAIPPPGKGARQSTLFRAASRAGDFGVTFDRALPLLTAWAAQCRPPLDPDEVAGALARAYPNRVSPIGCALGPDGSGIINDWAPR